MKYSYTDCILTHGYNLDSVVKFKPTDIKCNDLKQTITFINSNYGRAVTFNSSLGYGTYSEWKASVLDTFFACNAMNGQGGTVDVDSFSINHFDLCLNGEKVKFEACKDNDGVTMYKSSNGETFTTYESIFDAGYTVDCEELSVQEFENNADFTDTLIDHAFIISRSPVGATGIDVMVIVPKGDGVTIDLPPNTGAKIEAGRVYALGEDDDKPIRNDFIINNPNNVEINIVWDSLNL